jgi:hypothetical protein
MVTLYEQHRIRETDLMVLRTGPNISGREFLPTRDNRKGERFINPHVIPVSIVSIFLPTTNLRILFPLILPIFLPEVE